MNLSMNQIKDLSNKDQNKKSKGRSDKDYLDINTFRNEDVDESIFDNT